VCVDFSNKRKTNDQIITNMRAESSQIYDLQLKYYLSLQETTE